jgi:hypothetical protein
MGQPNEFDNLAAEAEAISIDQPLPGESQAPAVDAPPEQSSGALLAGMIELAREVFCTIGGVQSPRQVLTPGTVEQLGQAWGAVADKRGWNLSKMMGDYAAEVSAVMVTVPVVIALRRSVVAELEVINRKPAIEAANDAQAEPPAADHG